MTTKVYNPRKLSVVFGTIIIDRLSEDAIETEWETDAYADEIDIMEGEVTRTQTNDGRATVTVSVPRSAAVNAALSAAFNADKLAGNGSGIAPFAIRDELGNDVHASAEAWIIQAPPPSYTRDSGMNAWRFRCASLKTVHGGS